MAMYQMEPLFELPTGVVQLPTNMYTMESIMPELSVRNPASPFFFSTCARAMGT
jgi:hypothetical protein